MSNPHSETPVNFYECLEYFSDPVFGKLLPSRTAMVVDHLSMGNEFTMDVRNYLTQRAKLEEHFYRSLRDLSKTSHQKLQARAEKFSKGATPTPSAALEVEHVSSSVKMWLEHLGWTTQFAEDALESSSLIEKAAAELVESSQHRESVCKKIIAIGKELAACQQPAFEELSRSKENYLQSCTEIKKKKINVSAAETEKNVHFVQFCGAKNKYLLSIASVNEWIHSFHDIEEPYLLDELEKVERYRIMEFKACVTRLSERQSKIAEKVLKYYSSFKEKIDLVSPAADARIFALCNRNQPPHKTPVEFESTSLWADNSFLILSKISTNILKNYRIKRRVKMSSRFAELKTHRARASGCRKMEDIFITESQFLEAMKVYESLVDTFVHTISINTDIRRMESEISIIDTAIGPPDDSDCAHSWSRSSFKSSSLCCFCNKPLSTFALAKVNLKCRNCGLGCHPKCEFKIPPACTSTHPHISVNSAGSLGDLYEPSMSNYAETAMSTYANTTMCNYANTTMTTYTTDTLSRGYGLVLYDFTAEEEEQISVVKNQIVEVLSWNDDNGWALISSDTSHGIVPADYIENISSFYDASKKYCRACYDYRSNDEHVLSFVEGDIFEILGPDGDWVQVANAKSGDKGDVPGTYIEYI